MSCSFDCPYCGKAINIIQGMELAAGNEWTALIQSIPPSMIGALLRYLELFKPLKQSLRWSRRLALTQELMPMIKSGTVKRNGVEYPMPMQAWEGEMMKLVSNKPSSLVLPLKSNGYLLSIMVGRVEKHLAAVEAQQIEAQRNRGQAGTQLGMQSVGTVVTKAAEPKQKSAPPQGWQGKAKKATL
jgi:hypothetical protein